MFTNGNGSGKGLTTLYDPAQASGRPHDDALREEVANEVIDQVNREFPVGILRSPSQTDRQRIQERINLLVGLAFRRNNAYQLPDGYHTGFRTGPAFDGTGIPGFAAATGQNRPVRNLHLNQRPGTGDEEEQRTLGDAP